MNVDTKVRCTHCGRPGDQHRATDGRCPKHDKFPAAPRMPATEEQLAAWDRKIARHWNTETTFDPWVSAERR